MEAQPRQLPKLMLQRELGLLGARRGSRASGSTALPEWAEQHFLHNCTSVYCDLRTDTAVKSTISVDCSPDGRRVASTHGDYTVKVLDADTGRTVQQLTGHSRTPWVVTWHPHDPDTLLSGSLDHKVIAWSLTTRSKVAELECNRPIASLAVEPGGQHVAVASGNRLLMWSWREAGPATEVYVTKRRALRAVAYHPLGQPLLLTAEIQGKSVRLADVPVALAAANTAEQGTAAAAAPEHAGQMATAAATAATADAAAAVPATASASGVGAQALGHNTNTGVFAAWQRHQDATGHSTQQQEQHDQQRPVQGGHHHLEHAQEQQQRHRQQQQQAAEQQERAHMQQAFWAARQQWEQRQQQEGQQSSAPAPHAATRLGSRQEATLQPSTQQPEQQLQRNQRSQQQHQQQHPWHPCLAQLQPIAGWYGATQHTLQPPAQQPASNWSALPLAPAPHVHAHGAQHAAAPQPIAVPPSAPAAGQQATLQAVQAAQHAGGSPAAAAAAAAAADGGGGGGGGHHPVEAGEQLPQATAVEHQSPAGAHPAASTATAAAVQPQASAAPTAVNTARANSTGPSAAPMAALRAVPQQGPHLDLADLFHRLVHMPTPSVSATLAAAAAAVMGRGPSTAAGNPAAAPPAGAAAAAAAPGAGTHAGAGASASTTPAGHDAVGTAGSSAAAAAANATSGTDAASTAAAASQAAGPPAATASAAVSTTASAAASATASAQPDIHETSSLPGFLPHWGADVAGSDDVVHSTAGARQLSRIVAHELNQARAFAWDSSTSELPNMVKLRLWRYDQGNLAAPLQRPLLTLPYVVLCSELGASFSPCGRYLAACVVCLPAADAVRLGSEGDAPLSDAIALRLQYELRIYSLAGPKPGAVLAARAISAAHCLTCVQFSPCGQHVLLAYGRRHISLCSFAAQELSVVPVHSILEVYRASDLALVRVLPSLKDEVNAAVWHPLPGHGIVYGTKEGKVRILRHDTGNSNGKGAAGAAGSSGSGHEASVLMQERDADAMGS